MNGNFLRRVFGCERFAADYREFLSNCIIKIDDFPSMVRDDNTNKIKYLVSIIE